jgi:Fe2+ transport system protein FeoA
MGLTLGTRVCLVRVAPLGDPVELRLRGYRLSVRKHEAASVIVESA